MRRRVYNFRKQNKDYWRGKKALYEGNREVKRRSDGINKAKGIDWVTGRVGSKTFLLITRATINSNEEIGAKNEVALEVVAWLHWDATFKLISID